jgi:hypothetical protein
MAGVGFAAFLRRNLHNLILCPTSLNALVDGISRQVERIVFHQIIDVHSSPRFIMFGGEGWNRTITLFNRLRFYRPRRLKPIFGSSPCYFLHRTPNLEIDQQVFIGHG